MSSNRINLLRGFLSIFSSNIALIIISAISTPILTRLLGSGSYGEYATVLATFSILKIVTEAGTFNGVRKFIAEDRNKSDWENHVIIFYFIFSLIAIVTVMIALWVAYLLDVFTIIFGESGDVYLLIIVALLFSSQFFGLFRGVLMGFGREHYSEPLNAINQLIFLLCAIILILNGLGVYGALIGKIISFSIVTISALYFLTKVLNPIVLITVPHFKDVIENRDPELAIFGIYSVILALLISSLYNIDIILLRALIGDEQTGYYKAALVIAEFLWFVPMAIQYSLVHSTSEMWAKGQDERVSQLISKISRYSLLLLTLMSIGLVVLADVFVPFYFGESYSPAVTPLLLLLPGVIGFSIARPILAVGQGKGELKLLIATTSGAALLNVVLNLLLIPSYGMSGAAIATSVSYGSMVVLHYISAIKIGFDPFSDLRLLRIIVIATVTGVVLFYIEGTIPSGISSLIIIPVGGLLIYSTLSVMFGVIDPEDISDIQTKMRKLVNPP